MVFDERKRVEIDNTQSSRDGFDSSVIEIYFV